MTQQGWDVWADRGFLINPDPVEKISDVLATEPGIAILEHIAMDIPRLLNLRALRPELDQLPVYPIASLAKTYELQTVHLERLMQMYSYFASAYVYGIEDDPAHSIPAGVAVPFVELAEMVERPPILSYSNYVLSNWKRIDPNGGIVVDNLDLVQNFLGTRDEKWFVLIHVDIEAQAADALHGIQDASHDVKRDDASALEVSLSRTVTSIDSMIRTFRRMPEQCDSDVYYFTVRPYIFGFTDTVYEGVEQYGGKPQTFRGQTGAQSSIIPAFVAAFGLEHEQNGLTQHLEIMKNYMPRPHREFIARMKNAGIREFVRRQSNAALNQLYNECLRAVTEFRKQHYAYATQYIFEKVANPLGTGGTVFMDWLGKLIDETEKQYL